MYESNTGSLSSSLSSSNSAVFSDDVISSILSVVTGGSAGGAGGGLPGGGTTQVDIDTLNATNGGTVTVGAGTDVVFIQGSSTGQTTFSTSTDTPVLVFQGSGGVNVIISGGSDATGDRVVIGTAGNDKIIISDGKNTEIVLGTGNSSVIGGTGDDTIVGGLGNSTVTGGGGSDMLQLGGSHTNYHVTLGTSATSGSGQPQADSTSHVIVTNATTGVTTDVTGLQYVQLDGSDALIFADSTVEAGVATLYQAAFGRTAEFGGLDYWFDQVKAGASLHDIAVAFTHSSEFAADAALSDAAFVSKIYAATFGRSPDAGGLVYWEGVLAGGATRADVLTAFASVAALNESGALHTEATIVGSVTIVQNIV